MDYSRQKQIVIFRSQLRQTDNVDLLILLSMTWRSQIPYMKNEQKY